LTAAECFRWWDPAVTGRICAWSADLIPRLPHSLRESLGLYGNDDLAVALGLLLVVHSEYALDPNERLLPDVVTEVLEAAGLASLTLTNADIQQHTPFLIFTGTLDQVRRGWVDYLPSSLEADEGDRLDIECDPASG